MTPTASSSRAHAQLLEELSASLRAFLDDLAASRLADRVLVLVFSEFGRRVAENGSKGTDHGTAGPVLLAGPLRAAGAARGLPEPHRPGRRRPEDDGGLPPRLRHRSGGVARPAIEGSPGRDLRSAAALPRLTPLPRFSRSTFSVSPDIYSKTTVRIPSTKTRSSRCQRTAWARTPALDLPADSDHLVKTVSVRNVPDPWFRIGPASSSSVT